MFLYRRARAILEFAKRIRVVSFPKLLAAFVFYTYFNTLTFTQKRIRASANALLPAR